MPRYHLHVHNQSGSIPDTEGVELPGIEDASRHAIEGIRDILSDEVRSGKLDLRGRIEIAAADGAPLKTVRFADALRLHLDREAA
jgi:hypothetical protein